MKIKLWQNRLIRFVLLLCIMGIGSIPFLFKHYYQYQDNIVTQEVIKKISYDIDIIYYYSDFAPILNQENDFDNSSIEIGQGLMTLDRFTYNDNNNVDLILYNTDNKSSISSTTPTYIEQYNKGDIFTIALDLKTIDHQYEIYDRSRKVFSQIDDTDNFIVNDNGSKYNFLKLKINAEDNSGRSKISYLFVPPIPSKIVKSKHDFDWYKTQWNTGVNGNCGPSCVSMAIGFSKGYNISVKQIRKFIGMPYANGGIGFWHMIKALQNFKTPFIYKPIASKSDIFEAIDNNHVVIILYRIETISMVKGSAKYNMFGRYYNEKGGHYIVVKGYSKDGKYFIVADPMPSDWYLNRFRYADGISMIGKNRYYSVKEVMSKMNRNVIEIL